MGVLTAIITHLDAPRVEAQLGYLAALAPQSRFVVCHGGRREDFDELVRDGVDALFVEDRSLRGANRDQSYTGLLRALWEQRAEGDTGAELVYLIEYDHLILSPDFDLYGDLYAAVRWRPEYGAEDAIAEKAAGRAFVHPFKELEALNRIRETPVPVAHP